MSTVKLDTGYISGTVTGEPGKEVRIYRGIPYAAPPVGDLRWKPPQPVTPWQDIRECTGFSLVSPQNPNNPMDPDPLPISEDCLYLNVLTPAKNTSEKLPVLVWFHGGRFDGGNGNTPTSNSPGLPAKGIVLVSTNHRLGVMGLMASSDLSEESPHNVSGNYMFLDLIASLKWVQKNIVAFGGDPDNVTIAGFSGGGGKVIGMLTSPLAKGLFHKAIIESGSLYMIHPGTPLKDAEALGDRLFEKLGVSNLAEARALSWEKVVQAGMEIEMESGEMTPTGLCGFAVDGYVFPDSHEKIIAEGKHNAVPLLGVANYGESFGAGHLTPQQVPAYIDMFKGNNKVGVKGYACIFRMVPTGWRELGGTCGHGMEMHYVFNDLALPGVWRMSIITAFGETPPEGVTGDAGVTDEDRQDAEKVMAIWTEFMKTGSPGVAGLIDWPAWDESGDKYVEIGYPIQVKPGYSLLG
ncbi:MAG: carboxylesterase family protein [Dehalococcoidales bacterium]|nr:carboxylesterase family protein [Dehalococcoidales bacterium]